MALQGYAGEILKIDLTNHKFETVPTTDYSEQFIGGRGMATALYHDTVPRDCGALDPENALICATGPVAGFSGFTGNRWLACAKTAAGDSHTFSYGNLGGGWGIRLKYAGYDAIVVTGKSEKPVYVFVHDGAVEFRDASHLWGTTTFSASDKLKEELGKHTAVLTIGQAAENLVAFSTILADEGSSASGGIGTVMGSKKLKAICVTGNKRPTAADPERLSALTKRVHELTRGPIPQMWWIIPGLTKAQMCPGCGVGCFRHCYRAPDGRIYKSMCQPIDIYRRSAEKYFDGWNEVIMYAMRLCDGYGLDSSVMQAMIEWLTLCYRRGVMTEKDTGLPLSAIGGVEFIEELTRMIALREGFGDLLARGTIPAAESVGAAARELVSRSVMNRTNEVKDYDPRLILHNALLIATEPRRALQQVHEAAGALIAWLNWLDGEEGGFMTPEIVRSIAAAHWGGAAAADYTSYEGKALAGKIIQERTCAFESLVVCNARWPMLYNPMVEDHLGAPSIPPAVFSAITGKETEKEELYHIGERIINLQRVVLLREGWRDRLLDFYHEEPIQFVRFNRECRVPGNNGEVASRKNQVIDRAEFEKMKKEYYRLRGWDGEAGVPTAGKLTELGLTYAAKDLEGIGR